MMNLAGTSLEGGKERTRPRIIGLSGKIGSGKDTAGKILGNFGYWRVAFADAVREEASKAFPELIDEIWEKPTARRIRILLQWWGTEYRRHVDPDYWVKRLEETITSADPEDKFVITDLRFPNEAEMVKRLGGEVWKIVGREAENPGVDNHLSERIELIKADRTIPNSGTLEQLAEFIDVLLR
jgi:hypothetical protein